MPAKKKKEDNQEEITEEPLEGNGVFIFEDGSRYEGGWVKEGAPPAVKRKGQGTYVEGVPC